MPSHDLNLISAVPTAPAPLEQLAIQLHALDDVAIARANLPAGQVCLREGAAITLAQLIPSGHKFVLRDMQTGMPIRRYGQVIGFASREIRAGEHVHTHNLGVQDFERDYALGTDVRPVAMTPPEQRRTFMGYARPLGRAGTRNYIAVLSTVNCSAHTCRQIAV